MKIVVTVEACILRAEQDSQGQLVSYLPNSEICTWVIVFRQGRCQGSERPWSQKL